VGPGPLREHEEFSVGGVGGAMSQGSIVTGWSLEQWSLLEPTFCMEYVIYSNDPQYDTRFLHKCRISQGNFN
jgi:hypothetical protein